MQAVVSLYTFDQLQAIADSATDANGTATATASATAWAAAWPPPPPSPPSPPSPPPPPPNRRGRVRAHALRPLLHQQHPLRDRCSIAGNSQAGCAPARRSPPTHRPTASRPRVCRFFTEAFAPKSSYFYTASSKERADLKVSVTWSYEVEALWAHAAEPVTKVAVRRQPTGLAPVQPRARAAPTTGTRSISRCTPHGEQGLGTRGPRPQRRSFCAPG